MKLDTRSLRYLTSTDWRILTAFETGSRNHEVVPVALISSISGIRNPGDVQRSISTLAKASLIAKVKGAKYDGYRFAYGGLDYLGLHSLTKTGGVYAVGNQIGVGKESDIFVVAGEDGVQMVLKIHRLGRISFRTVKNKRDYLRKQRGRGASWMDMSRLAAIKEFAFMEKLGEAGMTVPVAVKQNRHMIVMSLVDGFPLRQVDKVPDPAGLYAELLEMVMRLAELGLIHGDFNEFNILIKEVDVEGGEGDVKLVPVLIDFPQMVSIEHENAEFYFQRDVDCVKRYFQRRYGFTSDEPGPFFKDAKKLARKPGGRRLDVEVEASGFSKKMAKELEAYMKAHGVDGDAGPVEDHSAEDEDDDDEDDDDVKEDDDEEHEEEDIRTHDRQDIPTGVT
jgi:RIO kinase 2